RRKHEELRRRERGRQRVPFEVAGERDRIALELALHRLEVGSVADDGELDVDLALVDEALEHLDEEREVLLDRDAPDVDERPVAAQPEAAPVPLLTPTRMELLGIHAAP